MFAPTTTLFLKRMKLKQLYTNFKLQELYAQALATILH